MVLKLFEEDKESHKKKLTKPAKIGIGVGVSTAIVAGIAYFATRISRNRKATRALTEEDKLNFKKTGFVNIQNNGAAIEIMQIFEPYKKLNEDAYNYIFKCIDMLLSMRSMTQQKKYNVEFTWKSSKCKYNIETCLDKIRSEIKSASMMKQFEEDKQQLLKYVESHIHNIQFDINANLH